MRFVKMSTMLSIITAMLVVFLAASAFVLSYDALRALASANGFANWRQYLWPLTLDAIVIVAILSVVRCNFARERAWFPWLLVIGFTLASIAFNILHAPGNWLAQSIATLPPLVVFLGLELLSAQLRSAIRQADRAYRDAHKDVKPSVSTEQFDTPLMPIEQAREHRRRASEQAVGDMLAFYAANPGATQAEAGTAVARSRQWVSGQLRELEARGTIQRNGDGIVVLGRQMLEDDNGSQQVRLSTMWSKIRDSDSSDNASGV